MLPWQERMCDKFEYYVNTEKDYSKLEILEKRILHFIYFDKILGNPEQIDYQEKLQLILNSINK